nr:uncharacterized protein LOC103429989 [Malus domestica]
MEPTLLLDTLSICCKWHSSWKLYTEQLSLACGWLDQIEPVSRKQPYSLLFRLDVWTVCQLAGHYLLNDIITITFSTQVTVSNHPPPPFFFSFPPSFPLFYCTKSLVSFKICCRLVVDFVP